MKNRCLRSSGRASTYPNSDDKAALRRVHGIATSSALFVNRETTREREKITRFSRSSREFLSKRAPHRKQAARK